MTKQTKLGRPTKRKGEHMVPTMVKMEPRLKETLQRLADEQRMTLSAYLRRIYEEHVCFSEAA